MTSTTDVHPVADPPRPPRRRRANWAALRPLVVRLHFYAGILIAPFLLVAAATGLLYAASFQIENVVYRHELTAPVSRTAVPLSEQVAAAGRALPEGKVAAVRPAAEPGLTTRVLFDVPDLPESTRMAVFVDPGTGQVRGALESYGGSGALPVRAWISDLHRRLHLGEPGRIYSELAASWLWVVALGGLTLWLTRRRRDGRRLRGLFSPDRAASGSRRTLSWHGSVGLWALLGVLFLSVTGLTWSKYAGDNIAALRTTFGWETPAINADLGAHAGHSGHAGHSAGGGQAGGTPDVGIDQVARAAAAWRLSGPLEVVLPAGPGDAYVVKEIHKTAPTRLDQIAFDPATGRVVGELRFADYPLAAKLTEWGIDAHMGLLFGLANQIVLAAIAAGVITLIVLGYRMWWRRRPTRGFGRPYPRGGWRGLHWGVLVPLALLTAVIGYYLPLMGISLAAFLVIDVLLGLRARSAR
ncbi:PepSY domain-containing protein [Microbispora cellulosiformans]|uniref:PepSY domain-containing protein n=1 Tax=Microbispora cellulosiformans TaxID=2614688 RepID=A0A5J5JVL7_9ACTN|nr:PepSY domain-containing protein [Microbispora cellulosiformans]KAA9374295.1 PepSY domain-containing protein [Microbispora cellulosiformans]